MRGGRRRLTAGSASFLTETAEATTRFWTTIGLILVLSAAGLTYEIAAGRVLAPFFGTSLLTWTAVIATVLAGFSLGSALGGLVAERERSAAAGSFRRGKIGQDENVLWLSRLAIHDGNCFRIQGSRALDRLSNRQDPDLAELREGAHQVKYHALLRRTVEVEAVGNGDVD